MVLVATGLARVFFGVKGMSWYISQPMFHLKITLVVAIAIVSIFPTIAFRRWLRQLRADGKLPETAEVSRVRRLVMVQAHVIPIVAVIAVFWARGW
ncbi:hypothetical protein D3C71_2020620 [compost metagenome]